MAYTDQFRATDDYIAHTNALVKDIDDPFIRQRYIGFITISAVTAYELAIKDILIEFARRKHNVFGAYIESVYERINGKISIKDLKKNHVPKFGAKYAKRFERHLDKYEKEHLTRFRRSIKSSYGNIITWRNVFVHEGNLAGNASYDEAVSAYEDGKQLIHVVARTMVR
ncbi:HEPN domain-containing protein [Halorhodospira sp. 9622]|uniref:HEPN domain-containing protein n=1 Tax=Halorhodospira sp. 9622 TaxID=2899136 RepID=UPI001EE99B5E|nr:HEPN domain-containing protein [Halorhodospira sp. 9622]MCG5537845.1 hypothetical protein [Halorhodospira sp. 9622]